MEINLYQMENMRIGKIVASCAKYGKEKLWKKSIFGISIVFQMEEILKIC